MLTLIRHLDRSRFGLALAIVDAREAVYLDDVPPDVQLIDLGCTRVRYALPRITRLIRMTRPDVVFSTLGHLNLALAMVRPLLPNGIHYVARETVVVSQNLNSIPRGGLWRWTYRLFYRFLDTVVCQSKDMREDLVSNFGFPNSKAVVIHNPVDIERIQMLAKQSPPEAFSWKRAKTPSIRLLAAGRLVPQKGFDLLIEALGLCDDLHLTLVILGEGPTRSELELLARRIGISERVRFAGFQTNPYPFFARADAFVLSSRFEGFSNVVLEALACGTPVIATPAPGGTREILDGIPECKVADDVTASSLAAAITAWCARPRVPVPPARVEPYALLNIVAQYDALLGSTSRVQARCRMQSGRL